VSARRTDDAPPAGIERRSLLRAALLGAVGLVAGPVLKLGRCRLAARATGGTPVTVSTAAVDVVLESTVVDMLGLLTLDWSHLYEWQRRPERFTLADFRQLEGMGVNVFHPAVETGSADPRAGVDRWMNGWSRLLRAGPCFLGEVGTINDLITLPQQGKIGVIVGFQNSTHFSNRADVRSYFDRGQRLSQLTYNARNRLGSGCLVRDDSGLTGFGTAIVSEMNRAGMAIDVSHCGERTSLEAIEASTKPVLVTHSNCLALSPGQPRCKSDRVIRAMARSGGVMGMTIVRAFVKLGGRPTIDDLIDHFHYAARLVGIEHVGLGSDVDPAAVDPKTGRSHPLYAIRGLDPVARVFQIADGLLGRGYSTGDVRLVLGDNFRRALAGTWPEGSWQPMPERNLKRDPFCPAPFPRGPGGNLGSEAAPTPTRPLRIRRPQGPG
jgi:membrane dipeptidase